MNRIESRLQALGITPNQLVLRLAGDELGVLGAWESVVENLASWHRAVSAPGLNFPRDVTLAEMTAIAAALECDVLYLLRLQEEARLAPPHRTLTVEDLDSISSKLRVTLDVDDRVMVYGKAEFAQAAVALALGGGR